MSRIYNSVTSITSYLPFGRKAPPAEPEKVDENPSNVDAKNLENGKHQLPQTKDQPGQNGDGPAEADAEKEETKDPNVKEDTEELPSNKKTDEVYDPKSQPGYIRWAAGGLVGAAKGTVGYGVGGIKWVASTGYNTTSAVVTTTTGVIKKVPQVIKRKDKKE